MEIDLQYVPSQIGTAVLDMDGNVLKVTGDFVGRQDACGSIYKILLDTAKCIGSEPIKRIVVSFLGHSYIATIGKSNVFIVKLMPWFNSLLRMFDVVKGGNLSPVLLKYYDSKKF